MNDNPKNNILLSENIRQKRLMILEYFDAYICHHYQPNKMLLFTLSLILCVTIVRKKWFLNSVLSKTFCK